MGHHFFTAEFSRLQRRIAARADVAELADASDLGSGALRAYEFESLRPHHLLPTRLRV